MKKFITRLLRKIFCIGLDEYPAVQGVSNALIEERFLLFKGKHLQGLDIFATALRCMLALK